MKLFLFFLVLIFQLHSSLDFDEAMGKSTSHWQYLTDQGEKLIRLVEKSHLESLSETTQYKIPKKIHVIWIGPKNFPLESLENIDSWKRHHQDWELHFWTDRKRLTPLEGMIFHSVDELDFSNLKKRYLESDNFAEKADILRFLILDKEGGIYIDHDALCLKSFTKFHQSYDFYIALEAPHEPIAGYSVTFGVSIIGSRANHPILQDILKEMDKNWDEVSSKFSANDLFTKYQLVMNRTYIHPTRVIEEAIKADRYLLGVFPASYFYPVGKMEGVYAKHLFANTWYFYGDYKKQKAHIEKVGNLGIQATNLWRLALLILLLSLGNFVFWLFKGKFS